MPLERNMLRYLLLFDPEIKGFKQNKKDVKVFMGLFLINFGLIHMTPDQDRQL